MKKKKKLSPKNVCIIYLVFLVLFLITAFTKGDFLVGLAGVIVFSILAFINIKKIRDQKKQEDAEKQAKLQAEIERKERREAYERNLQAKRQAEIERKERREAYERNLQEKFYNLLESIPGIEIVPEAEKKRVSSALPEIAFTNVVTRSNVEKLGDFTVIDTETTGLSPTQNEIIEVAAIRFRGFRPVAKFSTMCAAKHGIPEKATEVNGITEEMTDGFPFFSQITEQFQDFIGRDAIVGHNVIFDLRFLHHNGVNFGEARKYYDTYPLAKKVIPKEDIYNYKLGTVAEYYNMNFEAHRADADALISGLIFKNLVSDITGVSL